MWVQKATCAFILRLLFTTLFPLRTMQSFQHFDTLFVKQIIFGLRVVFSFGDHLFIGAKSLSCRHFVYFCEQVEMTGGKPGKYCGYVTWDLFLYVHVLSQQTIPLKFFSMEQSPINTYQAKLSKFIA